MRYLRRELYFSPNIYQVGLGVFLLSLSAFFLGLVIAFSFRIEAQGSWRLFHVPRFLWLSTAILIASSIALETGRYALRRGRVAVYRFRLRICIGLGLAFLTLQVLGATDLVEQGVATEANPHGAAFYVFMGIHGAHLIGGLVWLLYLSVRSRALFGGTETDLRKYRVLAATAAMYWHYMGLVWLGLFFFLLRWTRF